MERLLHAAIAAALVPFMTAGPAVGPIDLAARSSAATRRCGRGPVVFHAGTLRWTVSTTSLGPPSSQPTPRQGGHCGVARAAERGSVELTRSTGNSASLTPNRCVSRVGPTMMGRGETVRLRPSAPRSQEGTNRSRARRRQPREKQDACCGRIDLRGFAMHSRRRMVAERSTQGCWHGSGAGRSRPPTSAATASRSDACIAAGAAEAAALH